MKDSWYWDWKSMGLERTQLVRLGSGGERLRLSDVLPDLINNILVTVFVAGFEHQTSLCAATSQQKQKHPHGQPPNKRIESYSDLITNVR